MTTAIVNSATGKVIVDDLVATADRIRARMRGIGAAIIEIGLDLIAVKARLGHGHFINWLDRELSMSHRSAQRYIAAATVFGDKCDTVSFLPPTTIYKLSAPSTLEKTRADIVSRIETGEKVGPRDIDTAIRVDGQIHRRTTRRRKAVPSPRAIKRREREEARWQAEDAKRRQLASEAAAEAVTLLRKLPGDDFARIRGLLAEPDALRTLANLLKAEAKGT